MKTKINAPAPVSHTIQHKSRAANQAPLSKILQAYKDRPVLNATVQREALDDEDDLLQGKFEVAQREALDDEEEVSLQMKAENKTGLPDNLKAGVEAASGFNMDDVRVHYNSPKPAQLQALAYTQGTEIHVGPGQEKHLPHEAWHVVQQKQGRVKPTVQMQGVQVNDDAGLEKEADNFSREIFQYKLSDICDESVLLFKKTIQFGKDRPGSSVPLKGHDYANNLGKLFRELEFIGISNEIDAAIQIIDDNRPGCVAYEVDGEDKNIQLYSDWCQGFRKCVTAFKDLLMDSNISFIKEKITENIKAIKELMKDLPQKSIDDRVRVAYQNDEEKIAIMNKIDEAIRTISSGFVPTVLKALYKSRLTQ